MLIRVAELAFGRSPAFEVRLVRLVGRAPRLCCVGWV
jgi:hypothetical protein